MTTQELVPKATAVAKDSVLAIVSLVAGITGWTILPVCGGIVAIITGHLALNEIRSSDGDLSGNGLAIAGIALGYTCLALTGLIVLAILSGAFYSRIFDFVFLFDYQEKQPCQQIQQPRYWDGNNSRLPVLSDVLLDLRLGHSRFGL